MCLEVVQAKSGGEGRHKPTPPFPGIRENDGVKKGSSTNAGYNEQSEKTVTRPNKNQAPSKTTDDPQADAKELPRTERPPNRLRHRLGEDL